MMDRTAQLLPQTDGHKLDPAAVRVLTLTHLGLPRARGLGEKLGGGPGRGGHGGQAQPVTSKHLYPHSPSSSPLAWSIIGSTHSAAP